MGMTVAYLLTALPAVLFSQSAPSPTSDFSVSRSSRPVTAARTPAELSSCRESGTNPKAAVEFRKSQEALDYNLIDKAVSHLQKGIQYAPENLGAYNDLGTIYFN